MPSTWVHAFGFTLLPHTGGILAYWTNRKEITGWYATLKKPSWCPPNWVFGPVWTTLYTGMGYGSYLVWKELDGFTDKALIPLGLYGAQLVLSWAWTLTFFGAHRMGWAFVELLCICGTAAATTVIWYPINKTAAYLMVPYMAWLTFSSVLNYCTWRGNKDKED
ncbi:translocator protein [Heptranchias perlo]|uniref:translocator protein n=1 Tax=Heptranchias perlo TaxID=212740 RepID=UPI00355A14DF